MNEIIELGGQVFEWLDMERCTVLRYAYVNRAQGLCGIRQWKPQDGETDDALLARLVDQVLASRNLPQLVAAHIAPMGTDQRSWTAEMSTETARVIGRCNTEADRHEIARLGALAVVSMFRERIRQQARTMGYRPMSRWRRLKLRVRAKLLAWLNKEGI